MKIAFIGQKGIPTKQGGIEKHVEELSIRLAKAGFDVTVYSRPHYTGIAKAQKHESTKARKHKSTNFNKYQYKGVKVINLPSVNSKHLDAITHTFAATTHALFQDYDVIHYHGVGPSLLSFIPRIFKPRAKVMGTFHCIDRQHQKWGGFAKLMLGLGESAACRFPHETIAVSRALQKYCQYRFDRETAYIPNGVRTNDKKISARILKQYGLEKDNYIFAASRLVQHKGIHTLIAAYNRLGRTGKKLVIAGAGANTSEYVARVKELAQGNQNIIFTGQKSGADLEALFKNAYLFVQPSEAEGLSIALLEAMSYGVPVLVSNIEENLEPLNGLGWEFKNKDINDLAKKLKFVLKHGDWIKAIAKKAKRHVDKNYNWDDIASQTVSLYRKPLPAKGKLILKEAK